MPLENEWIGYLQRTYQQFKDSVLTNLQSLVPEITDHTESNLWVRLISIWGGIMEMLGYYIDQSAREAHLPTARLYRTGVKIAKSYDYRVHGHIPSTGDVTFILNTVATSAINIPANTEVENDEGILYYTATTAQILIGQTEVTVAVRQVTAVSSTALGSSDATPSQEFVITGDVVDKSAAVTVNAAAWQGQETLGFSLPADTHFIHTVNELKQTIVRFGDGVLGLIPIGGQAVAASYETTLGEGGNTGAFTIATINSGITLPVGFSISVENRIRTSGGRGVETLEEMKLRIPKSIRSQLRAVTDLDFIDLPALNAGVAKAGFIFDCGKTVDIYIVPDGGGIASSVLIADTLAWMQQYRLLLVNIRVFAAGEVNLTLVIDLEVLPQFVTLDTVTAVRDALTTFLSVANQDISGKVHVSDLYELIETTTGVKNSNITSLKAVPFGRILVGTNTLNWTRVANDANTDTVRWRITVVSGATYELFREDSFFGTHTFGVLIIQPEVEFTVISAAYSIGDSWEFYTYPSLVNISFGSIQITEPSLPVSLASDINITAHGGL